MVLSPKLQIADEPTSALDAVVQKQILSLLKSQVDRRGSSLILVTHEISVLNGLVEEVAVMYWGEIVERGQTRDVLLEPLLPYTEMLVNMLLTFDSSIEKLRNFGTTGSKYSGQGIGEGRCKYSNRCTYAFERCRTEKPRLKEVKTGEVGGVSQVQLTNDPTYASGRALVEVKNLIVEYTKVRNIFSSEKVRAVDDVSFSIRNSEVLSLVGASGSGKITIARCIMRLVSPDCPVRSITMARTHLG